ncbi:hypothetical protein JW796_02125 [Candidatus Dojkabacteria bacterium]|nr:hypothetical protein [Candidatus Dojkabacteria bacterium]
MKKVLISPLFTIILFIVILVFLFCNLCKADIQFWDEATNIGVIIESAKSSDWWNLKYSNSFFWEKPPLFYFLGIAVYNVFDQANMESMILYLRAISGFFALSIIYLCWAFLKKKTSLISANLSILVFLSIPALYLFCPAGVFATHNFRSTDSDILQLFFIVLGYFTLEGLFGDYKKIPNLVCIGVFSALAILTKGIFGFLPIFFLAIKVFFSIKKKEIPTIESAKIFLYPAIVCLLIILPWHIYMFFHFGDDFLYEYLLYHQIGRAGSVLEGHSQPIWFYLQQLLDPRISGILLPTLLLLVLTRFKITHESVIGLCIIFVFSLLQTKISWYVIPAYPFLIMYISKELAGILDDTKNIFSKSIGFLFLAYFTLQAVVIVMNLTTLPKGIQSFENTNQIFATDKELHRVFYLYTLKNESETIPLNDLKSDESKKVMKQIIVDRNEIETSKKFRDNFNLSPLTDNYSAIQIEE